MKSSFLLGVVITAIQLFSCRGKRIGSGVMEDYIHEYETGSPQRKLTSDWTQVGNSVVGSAVGDKQGYSTSLSEDGTRMVVGAANATSSNTGGAKVYDLINGEWQQVGGDLIPAIPAPLVLFPGANLGYDVTISRDGLMVFIAAPLQSTWLLFQGQVYAFYYIQNNWVQLGNFVTLAGGATLEQNGYSIATSTTGLKLVSGASSVVSNLGGSSTLAGKVNIWAFISGSTSWAQVGLIEGEDLGEFFGWDVAMNAAGNVIAVGAPNHGGGDGHVRVYLEVPGTSTSLPTYVQLGGDLESEQDSYFGNSVALSASGGRVAVGGILASTAGDKSGHVVVYDLDTSTNAWIQAGDEIHGEEIGERLGWSVSLSSDGNRIATSAPANGDNDLGRVAVYDYINPGLWVQAGPTLYGTGLNSWFGYSVSISGDGNTLAVGAPQEFLVGENTGRASVYELNTWFVYNTWASAEGSNAFDGRVKVENEIGQSVTAGNVEVTLFDSGCNTAKPSTGLVVSLSTAAFTTSPFVYYVDIEQAFIGNATDFVVLSGDSNSTGTIEFCTRVSTKEGSVEVGFRETNFKLNFNLTDMEIDFDLDFSIVADTPDTFITSVDSSFSVDVCQCDGNFVCYTSAQTVTQNENIVICLEPEGGSNSDVVEISNFNLLIEAGTAGSSNYYAYSPVEFGVLSWSPDQLTAVEVQSGTNRIKVSTPIVAQFFLQGFTSVDVNGSANLEFVSGKDGRAQEFKYFTMEIDLDTGGTQGGCLSNMMKSLRQFF